MMDEKVVFSHNLRRLIRKSRFNTYNEVALVLGTDKYQFSRYVNGRYIPSAKRLNQLARILEVNSGDFFRPIRKTA